jgi:hypothetical protein
VGAAHPETLIAVNRGSQFSAPFHFENGAKPEPRPLSFDGKTIAPIDAGIHPLQRGPMGESFTTALVRTHPEMAPSVGLRSIPGGNGFRSPYTPAIVGGRTFGAPSTFSAPRAGGFSSAGASHGSFSSSGGGGFSGGGGHVGGGSVSTGASTAPSAGASSAGGGGAHH